MSLFHVQDDDRPMYVVASNYLDAIAKWQKVIETENVDQPQAQPKGVAIICDDDDLITDRINAE